MEKQVTGSPTCVRCGVVILYGTKATKLYPVYVTESGGVSIVGQHQPQYICIGCLELLQNAQSGVAVILPEKSGVMKDNRPAMVVRSKCSANEHEYKIIPNGMKALCSHCGDIIALQ